MKRICSYRPLAAAFALFLLFSPAGAGAVELHVPGDYPNVQAAIAAAQAGDSVVVEPGTYQESIALKDKVSVRGRETARTFLTANGGAGPIVAIDSGVTATIRNFTFTSALLGLQVSNNPSPVSIVNNVFAVGAGNTAVLITGSPNAEIVNNTFSGNGTAVDRDADLVIKNNIFANNVTAISRTDLGATKITFNAFFPADTLGLRGDKAVPADPDPLFANPAKFDFHVRENSPCIDNGDFNITDAIDDTFSDIGAYGGPGADPIPFPVSDLTVASATDTSLELSWSPNLSYLVTNADFPGGYTLYYGYESGAYNGTDADGGTSPSPISVGPLENITLEDLNPTSGGSAAPVLGPPESGFAQLTLTWTSVPGASGYRVHYGISSPSENEVDAGNTTTYALTGLSTDRPYKVAVGAYAPAKYYIAVTAFDSTEAFHESAFSQEVTAVIGQTVEGALSNVRTGSPEGGVAYPALPGGRQGCFIATAAYGNYSAPEVLALRAFRDRYLLTSAAGKRLVRWYYRRGPVAAALLNAHPEFKPAVRAALMPVAGLAGLLTNPPGFETWALLFLGSAIAFGLSVRRRGPVK